MSKLWNSTLNAPTKPMKRTPFKSNKRPKKMRSKAVRFNTRTKALEFPQNIKIDIKLRDDGCVLCTTNRKANFLHAHHFVYKSANGLGIIENGIALCNHHHDQIHSHDLNGKLKQQLQDYLDTLYPNFDNSMRKYKKY